MTLKGDIRMAITAEMIGEKSFSSQFRGYNMDEVDDFLDTLMDEVDALLKQQAALTEQLAQAGQGGDAAAGQEISNLQSLLRASRQRVAQLEADLREMAESSDGTDTLKKQLDAAYARIAQLESTPAVDPSADALRAQLAQAQQRIVLLEARPAGNEEVEELRVQLKLAKKRINELEAITGNSEALLQQLEEMMDAKLQAAQEAMDKKQNQAISQLTQAEEKYQQLSVQMNEIKGRYLAMLQNQMNMFETK